MIQDLRDWLAAVEAIGQLQVVRGAHWRHEIGTISELWGSEAQALIFDDIVDHEPGWRLVSNALRSPERIALTLGLPLTRSKPELTARVRAVMKDLRPLPPRRVNDGPVLSNVLTGDDVDLNRFPAPIWHEGDGGRFLGTGCLTTTVDPDTGWVNFGAYRVQLHDPRTTGVYMTLGKHGRMMVEKYWQRGKACPIAVSLGHHPLLFMAAGSEVPHGLSEYDYAGGLRGEPFDVVPAPYTGIPVPALAEAVIEGEVPPGESLPEGPFGEWTGYYATGETTKPIIHVRSMFFRDRPIVFGNAPGRPPSDSTYFRSPFKAAALWDQIERAGAPGVRAVWCHEAGGARMLVVAAIRQMYPGHSKQVGHLLANCHQGAYTGKLVVVVDDDIDPSDTDAVLWALCTRIDLRSGLDIMHRCWTSPVDPMHYPADEQVDVFNSRAIIDACRPWERRATFPEVCAAGPQARAEVLDKWRQLFAERRPV